MHHSNPLLSESSKLIQRALSLVGEHANQVHLSVVVNTKAEFLAKDGNCRDLGITLFSEYLSDEELDQIVSGARHFGVAVDVFVGEKAFVSFLSSGEASRIKKAIKLVYSTSGSITGRGGSSFIPSLAELYGVYGCTSDAYSLALLENKFHTFCLIKLSGIPTLPFWLFHPVLGWRQGESPELGCRVIAKPLYGCASIGIDADSEFAWSPERRVHLCEKAQRIGQPLLVQQFMEGYEVEIPVSGFPQTFSLGVAGVAIDGHRDLGERFLNYNRVLSDDYSFYDFCRHAPEMATSLRQRAEAIYTALDLTGLARIDFRLSDRDFFPTDINSIPHLTQHGGVAACLGYAGGTYRDAMGIVIATGISRAMLGTKSQLT